MIKVGIAQIKNSIEISENFLTIKKCLALFEKTKTDLVLFPECALSGFSAQIKECTYDVVKGYLEELSRWSKINNKIIVLPTALKDGDVFNSGFIVTSEKIEQFYKVGLTVSEKSFFSTPESYRKQIFKVKNYHYLPLICLEAQEDTDQYFDAYDVDFILWPGYWGWEKKSRWESLNQDGSDNEVYLNVEKWKTPLIQCNFAYNNSTDGRVNGPHGLSVVIDSKNRLRYRASFEKEECFIVEIDDNDISHCYHLSFL